MRHFFFSSRRRHTRFDCDWSSDVCSSDLMSTSAATLPGATTPLQADGTFNFSGIQPGTYRRSEEHTSELQSQSNLVCRLLLEKKKKQQTATFSDRHIYADSVGSYTLVART